MWKNFHPVYSAGTQTNVLLNMSCHPLPLDQGSRPIARLFVYNNEKLPNGKKIAKYLYTVKI